MTSGPPSGQTVGGETQRQQTQQQQLPLTLTDPVSPQPLLQPIGPPPADSPADAAEGQVIEGGEEEEEEEEPPWEEARRARRARDPGAPSVADWEAH